MYFQLSRKRQCTASFPSNVCNLSLKRLHPLPQTFAIFASNVCGEKTPFCGIPSLSLLFFYWAVNGSISDAVHCNRSRSALHPPLQCTASFSANVCNRPCKRLWDKTAQRKKWLSGGWVCAIQGAAFALWTMPVIHFHKTNDRLGNFRWDAFIPNRSLEIFAIKM